MILFKFKAMNAVKSELTRQEMKSLIKKIMIRFSLLPIVVGLIVLLPAGTFNYWQVYLYLAVLVIPMIFVLSYFLHNDPKFLERRTRAKEKEKAQLIIQIGFSLIFLSGFVIPGLDKRFSWSDIPVHIVILADVVVFSGYLIIFFVFKQNSYASRVVETDENQRVITTGLYAIVRHPMYIGVLIMFITTPVALGSYWGLIPMATIPVALVFRILNEEQVLIKNLPGYKEYCRKTRYRLIPFIW
jgi:protein-S-isoprenylcysteine O-methyltransferase Ste14